MDDHHHNPNSRFADSPNDHVSIGRYFATRITTLKPPMARVNNPIRLLRLLNFQQWMFFLVAFFAWTWVRSALLSDRRNLTNVFRMHLIFSRCL